MNISDSETQLLAELSDSLRRDYEASKDLSRWEHSKFAWLKGIPSRTVGAQGEQLLSKYLESKGFAVSNSPGGESDRMINGKRAEIKLSTLWEGGKYKFQQIRKQDYDFIICLGLSPFIAHCWAMPKQFVMQKWEDGDIGPQHGGQAGKDTAWMHVDPEDVQPLPDYPGAPD